MSRDTLLDYSYKWATTITVAQHKIEHRELLKNASCKIERLATQFIDENYELLAATSSPKKPFQDQP